MHRSKALVKSNIQLNSQLGIVLFRQHPQLGDTILWGSLKSNLSLKIMRGGNHPPLSHLLITFVAGYKLFPLKQKQIGIKTREKNISLKSMKVSF